jgi:hypothetical protein
MGHGLDVALAEIELATARVQNLQLNHPTEVWRARPAVGKWSAIECIEHLNITSKWYIEHFEKLTGGVKAKHAPERMSFLGWIVWRSQRSRKKYMESQTVDAFVPPSELDANNVLREFFELQERLRILISHVSSLPLSKIKMTSPFNKKIKYDLYSAIRIISAHELRHLDQAERAIAAKK